MHATHARKTHSLSHTHTMPTTTSLSENEKHRKVGNKRAKRMKEERRKRRKKKRKEKKIGEREEIEKKKAEKSRKEEERIEENSREEKRAHLMLTAAEGLLGEKLDARWATVPCHVLAVE